MKTENIERESKFSRLTITILSSIFIVAQQLLTAQLTLIVMLYTYPNMLVSFLFLKCLLAIIIFELLGAIILHSIKPIQYNKSDYTRYERFLIFLKRDTMLKGLDNSK